MTSLGSLSLTRPFPRPEVAGLSIGLSLALTFMVLLLCALPEEFTLWSVATALSGSDGLPLDCLLIMKDQRELDDLF